MSFLPPGHAKRRAPRVRLTDTTPAVLRLQNGWRIPGKLQVISVTGGLLSLSKPLSQGCEVKVMFPGGDYFKARIALTGRSRIA